MKEKAPPTLDYSTPEREPVDPIRAVFKTLAMLIAIPLFLVGTLLLVQVGSDIASRGVRSLGMEHIAGGALGIGLLYLTHRLSRFRR